MKKAIVIGATSGIGKETAKILAKNAYIVGITGRRKELLKELEESGNGAFVSESFDVTDTDAAVSSLDKLAEKLGGVDLLLLSSGTGYINKKLYFNIEKDTIDTNVTGFTCVCDWAFTYFQKQGSGHLAALTSVAGIRGDSDAPAYNATKSYQINYLEGLRKRAVKSRKNIYVTDIRPGFVATEMAKGAGLFWVAPVEKAAEQIFKAIKAKKKTVYVTKRWFFVSVILKFIPAFIYNKF